MRAKARAKANDGFGLTAVDFTVECESLGRVVSSYDTLERAKAGIAAYGHLGERRNNHKSSDNGTTDGSVTRS
jgi:hypothetical protein